VKRTAQRAFTAINHSLTALTERFVEYDSKLEAVRQMLMFPGLGWLWTQVESTRLSRVSKVPRLRPNSHNSGLSQILRSRIYHSVLGLLKLPQRWLHDWPAVRSLLHPRRG
jgi:hypothetical protein